MRSVPAESNLFCEKSRRRAFERGKVEQTALVGRNMVP
ncbi:hypothetical protein FTUN_2736 [Frigoriglobus tundricola]|uniref:Uncharacterized protein n=1 Tax=Frigoriglobus tundricola TaxID=2774151 RepID=A0A6M5YMB6_9BACT|nr:hypothetical protein FTUN_2736 [Frigoriglobus tundricola]